MDSPCGSAAGSHCEEQKVLEGDSKADSCGDCRSDSRAYSRRGSRAGLRHDSQRDLQEDFRRGFDGDLRAEFEGDCELEFGFDCAAGSEKRRGLPAPFSCARNRVQSSGLGVRQWFRLPKPLSSGILPAPWSLSLSVHARARTPGEASPWPGRSRAVLLYRLGHGESVRHHRS